MHNFSSSLKQKCTILTHLLFWGRFTYFFPGKHKGRCNTETKNGEDAMNVYGDCEYFEPIKTINNKKQHLTA